MQPKKVEVGGGQPRLCPACGTSSARLVRADTYLSLFFLPVVPIKRGQEYLECSRCGRTWDPNNSPQPPEQNTKAPANCPRCARPLEPQFVWCPHCGQKVRAA